MMIGTDWTIIGVDEIQLPYYREYGGAHIGLIVVCLFFGVYRHVQQYISYIVAVSFIGGGNRSTRRIPPTCRKSLTNILSHNVVSSTPRLNKARTHKVSGDRH
jgi:hypothetical protein